jgi:hypothetical protein
MDVQTTQGKHNNGIHFGRKQQCLARQVNARAVPRVRITDISNVLMASPPVVFLYPAGCKHNAETIQGFINATHTQDHATARIQEESGLFSVHTNDDVISEDAIDHAMSWFSYNDECTDRGEAAVLAVVHAAGCLKSRDDCTAFVDLARGMIADWRR